MISCILDRCTDDNTMNNMLLFLSYKTNVFHVVMGLFINRSQKSSKNGKMVMPLFCSNHFTDIICDLLMHRHTAVKLILGCSKLTLIGCQTKNITEY